jgi:amino-acid N-acetyltransferase
MQIALVATDRIHRRTAGRVKTADTARVRSATAADAPVIHRLIAKHAAEGHLLPRTLGDLADHADRFLVATLRGRIVGCTELAPLSTAVAEVRSFVVSDRCRGRGLGRLMVEELRSRARRQGFEQLCAFTHAPSYFERLDFSIVPHASVPDKIATDCRGCALFGHCGQYAMVLELESAADSPSLPLSHQLSPRP